MRSGRPSRPASPGTSTKLAKGAMIGIATVARPDDDGIRNDSGKNSPYITIANAALPTSPRASSAQCRTVSVIWPLFMTTVIPRAIPMMRATPRRSLAPSTNVVGQLSFTHAADEPDHDREQEERCGHLREPPPERGKRDPEVFPGDDAVHHDAEREPEHDEHGLLRAGHDDGVAAARRFLLLGAEPHFVVVLHVIDERLRRIGLHPVRVPQHEEDADPESRRSG